MERDKEDIDIKKEKYKEHLLDSQDAKEMHESNKDFLEDTELHQDNSYKEEIPEDYNW